VSIVIADEARSYFFGANPRAIRPTINKDDRCYTSIPCAHSIPA
jgi:hypothetical protein